MMMMKAWIGPGTGPRPAMPATKSPTATARSRPVPGGAAGSGLGLGLTVGPQVAGGSGRAGVATAAMDTARLGSVSPMDTIDELSSSQGEQTIINE